MRAANVRGRSIALIIIAAIGRRSAVTNGMTFGYLIWSRDLPASFAAGVVRRCGRIGRAQRSMRDTSQMVYERGLTLPPTLIQLH